MSDVREWTGTAGNCAAITTQQIAERLGMKWFGPETLNFAKSKSVGPDTVPQVAGS
jgi:hypothetical protein